MKLKLLKNKLSNPKLSRHNRVKLIALILVILCAGTGFYVFNALKNGQSNTGASGVYLKRGGFIYQVDLEEQRKVSLNKQVYISGKSNDKQVIFRAKPTKQKVFGDSCKDSDPNRTFGFKINILSNSYNVCNFQNFSYLTIVESEGSNHIISVSAVDSLNPAYKLNSEIAKEVLKSLSIEKTD